MSKQAKIAIICHTCSDMALDYAEKMGIYLLSDIVTFGDERLRILRDIDSPAFFDRLEAEKKLPTISQPPLSAYLKAFEQAACSGCTDIVCMLGAVHASNSYITANVARTLMREQGFSLPIYLYDAKQSSYGLNFMAAFAARCAGEGMSAAQIIRALDHLRTQVGSYCIFDSLQYARRSKYKQSPRVLIADLLGFRPVFLLSDGRARPVGLPRRAYKAGIAQLLARYESEWGNGDEVIVFHSRMDGEAAQIATRIHALSPNIPVRLGEIGPVTGLYAGPKCIGITFRKREKVQAPRPLGR